MQPDDGRVIVVGTTADYIEWIRTRRPGEALFLTEPAVRHEAAEQAPPAAEEVLCDLSDAPKADAALADHLARWRLKPAGVACYDCESMALAARLAATWDLPYPSLAAVDNCRDKYRSKRLWRRHNLDTPAVGIVGSAAAAIAFFKAAGGPVVLKPLSGSGSEFVFRCDSTSDCERHYAKIARGLERRRDHRLYRSLAAGPPPILAETHAAGEEYSCDFVLEDKRVTLIRLARKVRFDQEPFGTASAYILPGVWPAAMDPGAFEETLLRSARALGLERAVCMLDFILCDGRMVLLEMAPRPGGDCLPPLVRRCCGLDVRLMMLDFGRKKAFDWRPPETHPPMVGLRLHAGREGRLIGIDDSRLRQDPRTEEIHLIRKPGHVIRRPPEDYDAWLLGHALFRPDPGRDIAAQCRELADKLVIEVADP